MELQEEINALKAENNQYKEIFKNLSAEKIALDQMYVESIKNLHQAKKELLLEKEEVRKTATDYEVMKKERDAFKKKIEDDEESKKLMMELGP